MFNRSLIGSMLALGLLFAVANTAAAPRLMPFQGRLLDNAGNPLSDGPKGVRIVIWNDPTATVPFNEIWNSGSLTVTTEKGLFSVDLGAPPQPAIDPNVMKDSSRWIGITVGADPEMSPRIRLGATPYAWTADYANQAGWAYAANSAITADLATTASNANYASLAGTANSVGWSGITNKPAGFADGVDDNTTYSASSPIGLTGTTFNLIPGSITDGYIGASANILPSKISGTAATLSGSQTFTGTNYFNAPLRVGDSAFYATPNYAVVIGQTPSPFSDRLLHLSRTYNSASSRVGLVVDLINNGGDAKGAEITARSDYYYRYGIIGTGISRTTNLTTGVSYGVYGSASYGGNVYGVYGIATGSGTGSGNAYGIYGYASNALYYWAGYFNGWVNVTGMLSKGGGSFRIDHPLDPENKLLQHSFVESPDMMNIYNGNLITDGNGDATITMPAWFDALNRDFRYQLTAIGQFAQAIVSSKMIGNSFSIRTDKPNVEVSWQVTGIRKDAFANANRIQVEVDKQPDQRGKYLHPAAFNLPEERGIDYEQIKAAREAREQQKTDGPR